IPVGESLTVGYRDTLYTRPNSTYPSGVSLSVRGSLINEGQVNALNQGPRGDIYVSGTLTNYGNIFADKAFSITASTTGGSIRNEPGGSIILGGYIDMYSDNAYFENAGHMRIIRGLGHVVSGYLQGFTAGLLRGTIKNTGMFVLDRDNGLNLCLNYGKVTIINEGIFEVKKGSTCDFGGVPDPEGETIYRQTKGETIVDGVFGAHKITLQ